MGTATTIMVATNRKHVLTASPSCQGTAHIKVSPGLHGCSPRSGCALASAVGRPRDAHSMASRLVPDQVPAPQECVLPSPETCRLPRQATASGFGIETWSLHLARQLADGRQQRLACLSDFGKVHELLILLCDLSVLDARF